MRWAWFGCLVLLCGHSASAAEVQVYTSTRAISAVAVATDGSLWAATRGGVIHRTPDGSWRKFTVVAGLPSNEALGIALDGDTIVAAFPEASTRWENGAWSAEQPKPIILSQSKDGRLPTTTWQGKHCAATLTELTIGDGAAQRSFALPVSTGSHISALLPRGDKLWAAMFGDGVWEFDGKGWSLLDIGLPPQAREITCMADDGRNLWLGTRREGVWQFDGKSWVQHLQPDEPYDHNIQSIFQYHGNIYFSTLEEGLVARTAKGWVRYSDDVLSSNSPRQMVEFGGRLYVRHGSGKLDRFDGSAWTRNVFPNLPRKQASALATDGKRLYVAQWGGWSEFDGTAWRHNLKNPELQGYPITALLPAGGKLWIGTQGRGLAEVNTATNELKWHDERAGLPDDWIKVITQIDNTLLAGTFVGGLASWDGSKWTTPKEFSGTEITAIEPDTKGGAIIATRSGLYLRSADGVITPLIWGARGVCVSETQSICPTNKGLWVGTRTGIYFQPASE